MALFHGLGILLLAAIFPLSKPVAQPSFAIHQYGVEDGLSSSFIYDITQDQEGFIWISAEGGLCRFDGNKFEKNPIPAGLTSEVVELRHRYPGAALDD